MIKVIDEGRKEDKGNAICPQCGKKVLIDKHWGDPPKCGDCGIPYQPIQRPPRYM